MEDKNEQMLMLKNIDATRSLTRRDYKVRDHVVSTH